MSGRPGRPGRQRQGMGHIRVPIRVPSRAPPRRLQRPDKFGQEQARPAQSGASAAQTASRVGCATCTPPSRRLRLLKRRWSASGRAAQEQTADAHSRTCLVELVSGVANRRCRRASQHARLTGVRKLEIRQSDLISWDQLAVFPCQTGIVCERVESIARGRQLFADF